MDKWIRLAERNALYPLAYDSLDRAYSERYVRRHKIWLKILAGLISMLSRNADLPRFIIQAKAVENFNCTDKLSQITCPVLVIGAAGDKVLGVSGARALKEGIADAEYYEYKDLGHAAYIEAKDFNYRILEFLKK
uniref:alpha/beta fold hydrolase n=1 Tax=uncultured Scardovia sp. TaxID=655654 RepID=UPI00374FB7C0